MSTFMEKPKAVVRKWYILDAAGKPLGRTAAQAAVLLTAVTMSSSSTLLRLF